MSLPDTLMESYYQLLTDLPLDQVRASIAANPRDAKIALAKQIIARCARSMAAADAAEAAFIKQFVKHEAPDEMPEFTVGPGPHKIAHLLVTAKLAASNGEAIRKVKEGGGPSRRPEDRGLPARVHNRQRDGGEARPKVRAVEAMKDADEGCKRNHRV
jgi:tyrosyl-tRNA synthetase